MIPILLLLLGCSTAQPVAQAPACPPAVVCPAPTVVHDSFTNVVHERVPVNISSDTTPKVFNVSPLTDDSYQMMQDAITFCQDNHFVLSCARGDYKLSHPLLILKIVGGLYQQVTIDIEGAVNAKNAPNGATTNFIALFNNGPTLGTQQCKGCTIANIKFTGMYKKSSNFNVIQIDTLGFDEWDDGLCSSGATNPETAIAVDFASDSTLYDGVAHKMYDGLHYLYLPGMSRSGSTAINIRGCAIGNFVVGIVITPSNQENGELINVDDCHIDYCKVVYGFCQAQSKSNTVHRLMCWGNVHTVFDGVHYGFRHGNGATCPDIDGVNLAGYIHQFINAYAYNFAIYASNVYAEGLFKVGNTGGFAGVTFSNWTIDFQLAPGVPMPDYYVWGSNIFWMGCELRIYNNGVYARLILNGQDNLFACGSMNVPPVCIGAKRPPLFMAVSMYDLGTRLDQGGYDTLVYCSQGSILHVDKSSYTGYLVGPNGGFAVGRILMTSHYYLDPSLPSTYSYQYPVGFVTGMSGDTTTLVNIGWGLNDGDKLEIWDARTKPTL